MSIGSLAVKPLPNDKFWTKLKAIADNESKCCKKMISILDRVQNTTVKGENGYQYFLLFPQCFQRPSSLGLLKVGFVW